MGTRAGERWDARRRAWGRAPTAGPRWARAGGRELGVASALLRIETTLRAAAAVAAVAAALAPAVARAQGNLVTHVAPPTGAPEPSTKKFKYSPYEQYSVDAALRDLHLEVEPDPEGKIVESIQSVRLEVFEKRDPVPGFLNVFHTVTRAHVIDREVVLRPGDAYHQALADETQRNLAQLMQLSLVLVIATKGTSPDKVRILVITKDVWSIRLQWDIALTNGGLEHLTLNPAETNLAGLHHNLGARFDYLPESSSFGARYIVPRLFGTRVATTVDANMIVSNRTGSPEGTFGQVSASKPLWSALTEWEWGAGVSWRYEITRRYRNAQQAQFALDPATKCADTPQLCVPWRYHSDLVTAAADVTRSFGWQRKHDFTLAFEARHRAFRTDDLSNKDPATVAAFVRTRVPLSDDRVGPYLQYKTYETNYLRVLDLESLALQEDYSVGLGAYVRAYPILRALGSSRDVFGVSLGVQYTLPIKDGWVRAGAETVAELQVDKGAISDGSVSASVRIVSPRSPLGRLVLDGYVLRRYENYLNRLSFLGGDTRLRGYPSGMFAGPDLVTANLEYRSRPVQLFQSVQIAGVLFYDVGDAFDDWKNFHPKHTSGFGARVLFPQLDRTVFRVDLGFPLSLSPLPVGVNPVSFFVTFDQAFGVPGIDPKSAVTR